MRLGMWQGRADKLACTLHPTLLWTRKRAVAGRPRARVGLDRTLVRARRSSLPLHASLLWRQAHASSEPRSAADRQGGAEKPGGLQQSSHSKPIAWPLNRWRQGLTHSHRLPTWLRRRLSDRKRQLHFLKGRLALIISNFCCVPFRTKVASVQQKSAFQKYSASTLCD